MSIPQPPVTKVFSTETCRFYYTELDDEVILHHENTGLVFPPSELQAFVLHYFQEKLREKWRAQFAKPPLDAESLRWNDYVTREIEKVGEYTLEECVNRVYLYTLRNTQVA